MADSGSDIAASAKAVVLSPLETIVAKEAKNEFDCLGKPLGCSILRCFRDCSTELSGDSVLPGVTRQAAHKGKPPVRRRIGSASGNPTEPKP